jgi:hypothetical protein
MPFPDPASTQQETTVHTVPVPQTVFSALLFFLRDTGTQVGSSPFLAPGLALLTAPLDPSLDTASRSALSARALTGGVVISYVFEGRDVSHTRTLSGLASQLLTAVLVSGLVATAIGEPGDGNTVLALTMFAHALQAWLLTRPTPVTDSAQQSGEAGDHVDLVIPSEAAGAPRSVRAIPIADAHITASEGTEEGIRDE